MQVWTHPKVLTDESNDEVKSQDDVLEELIDHFKKEWLSERNIGWHSGLVPGTVTSNNGLEVTNRIFKANLKVSH